MANIVNWNHCVQTHMCSHKNSFKKASMSKVGPATVFFLSDKASFKALLVLRVNCVGLYIKQVSKTEWSPG